MAAETSMATMNVLKTSRRRWLLLAALVAATATGCAQQPPFQDLPSGGVDATTGPIVISDVWIDGPHGVPAGSEAPLRLVITNNASTAEELVGVSSPAARSAVLKDDGRVVTKLSIPADGSLDLEWSTGVELRGFHKALASGQYVAVTLTFSQAPPITTDVAVGPLPVPAVARTAGPTLVAGCRLPHV